MRTILVLVLIFTAIWNSKTIQGKLHIATRDVKDERTVHTMACSILISQGKGGVTSTALAFRNSSSVIYPYALGTVCWTTWFPPPKKKHSADTSQVVALKPESLAKLVKQVALNTGYVSPFPYSETSRDLLVHLPRSAPTVKMSA